jgi:hypothetical protein
VGACSRGDLAACTVQAFSAARNSHSRYRVSLMI